MVPQVDQILLGDCLYFGEVHNHTNYRGSHRHDDLSRQRDLYCVAMTVQISALALVIGNAVAGIEFEPSRDAHVTRAGLE